MEVTTASSCKHRTGHEPVLRGRKFGLIQQSAYEGRLRSAALNGFSINITRRSSARAAIDAERAFEGEESEEASRLLGNRKSEAKSKC